jgi:hypothetical protein
VDDYIIVCANVPDNDLKAFDDWYEREHLADSLFGFRAISASRGWSIDNLNIHSAYYEFENLSDAKEILKFDALEKLVKKFDCRWNGKIIRTRKAVEIVQQIKFN